MQLLDSYLYSINDIKFVMLKIQAIVSPNVVIDITLVNQNK